MNYNKKIGSYVILLVCQKETQEWVIKNFNDIWRLKIQGSVNPLYPPETALFCFTAHMHCVLSTSYSPRMAL